MKIMKKLHFFRYPFTIYCGQQRLHKNSKKTRCHKGSRGSMVICLISIQLNILGVRRWTCSKNTAQHQLWGWKKNCMEGTQTSLTKLPKKVLRINAKKNGSCHSGTGRTHQTLICLHWLFCIVLANKWTYTLGVAILIS